jgi:hypothetical protein
VVADNALNIGSLPGDHHLQRSGDRLQQRRPDGRQRHLSTVSSSDGGITWTATFTPTSNITDASNLITLNNTGYRPFRQRRHGTTDSNNYAIDTQRPTATIVVATTTWVSARPAR